MEICLHDVNACKLYDINSTSFTLSTDCLFLNFCIFSYRMMVVFPLILCECLVLELGKYVVKWLVDNSESIRWFLTIMPLFVLGKRETRRILLLFKSQNGSWCMWPNITVLGNFFHDNNRIKISSFDSGTSVYGCRPFAVFHFAMGQTEVSDVKIRDLIWQREVTSQRVGKRSNNRRIHRKSL